MHKGYVCTGCNQFERDVLFKKCGGCRVARYCSTECQKKHWKMHKPGCQDIRASLVPSAPDEGARHRMWKWIEDKEQILRFSSILRIAIGATHNLELLHQYVLAVRLAHPRVPPGEPIGRFHMEYVRPLTLADARARGGEWVRHVDEIENLNACGADPAVHVGFETTFGVFLKTIFIKRVVM
ncbi:hypothetical protein C8J57DRAFT_1333349 [Mycena rebaudengoi]|nr:hypothetical protein C8J57DRAFT_1333349 [Mycena rebaudengoi]